MLGTDTVTITGRVDANILPNADNTINLGQGGGTPLKFNTVYATTFSGTATTARYADLAEKYLADEAYEARYSSCTWRNRRNYSNIY